MGERYTRLFSLPENLYSTGAPVIIAAGALLKDNQTGKVLAQLKLRSISSKPIKAATVSIQPLDTVGISLGDSVTYQYLDLQVDRDADFGQRTAIPLPNPATRSFGVIVTEAIFTDNSIWHGDNQTWEALAEPTDIDFLGDKELTKQFRMEYGGDCKNLLLEQKNLWHCVCGAINRKDETNCHLCRRNLSVLQSIDMDELRRAKEDRRAAEKEQADKEAAEAKIKEDEARAQAKKVGKLAAVVVPALAIVIIAATIISGTVKKENAYKDALALMGNEQYEEAITAFTALDGYKDSAEQIVNAQNAIDEREITLQINRAKSLIKSGKSGQALEILEGLGKSKEAEALIQELDNTYDGFTKLVEDGAFDDAQKYWDEKCKVKFSGLDYKEVAVYVQYMEALMNYLSGEPLYLNEILRFVTDKAPPSLKKNGYINEIKELLDSVQGRYESDKGIFYDYKAVLKVEGDSISFSISNDVKIKGWIGWSVVDGKIKYGIVVCKGGMYCMLTPTPTGMSVTESGGYNGEYTKTVQ